MSYEAKNSAARNQQLKVQELCVSLADVALSVDSGANHVVIVGEPLASVRCALKIAADGTVTGVAVANLSIVDSAAYTAGGDEKAILLTGVQLAAGDQLMVKYQAQV